MRGEHNPQVEIFKSFRVSIDDPCHKVLPVALKKYNITADWRQYALYIVHGDQERCLGLNEKPLILFKQLDKDGRKPMFMLRKHATPAEGHTVGVNGGGGGAGYGGGLGGGRGEVALPGGVLPGGVL
jgi:protein STE50